MKTAPWYIVELRERSGQTDHWSCRAESSSDAMSKAAIALAGTGDEILRAEFDRCHLENRVPDSASRCYQGILLTDGCCWVTVTDKRGIVHDLEPRLDLANHSSTGFAWGYAGSGPSQLALALLADALRDDAFALMHYQAFKAGFITPLPQDKCWRLSEGFVRAMAASIVAGLPK